MSTMQNAVWKTRDGRELPVHSMELDHMRRCVQMVSRGPAVSAAMLRDCMNASAYAADAPDGASLAAEAEADELFTAALNRAALKQRLPYAVELYPVIKAMVGRLEEAKVDLFTEPDPLIAIEPSLQMRF